MSWVVLKVMSAKAHTVVLPRHSNRPQMLSGILSSSSSWDAEYPPLDPVISDSYTQVVDIYLRDVCTPLSKLSRQSSRQLIWQVNSASPVTVMEVSTDNSSMYRLYRCLNLEQISTIKVLIVVLHFETYCFSYKILERSTEHLQNCMRHHILVVL